MSTKSVQRLKPGDIVIIGCVMFGIAASMLGVRTLPGNTAVISIDNEIRYALELGKDRILTVKGAYGDMVIKVEAGEIWVEEVHCPRKVCMRTGRISQKGQTIVCLPNRIIIRIEGNGNEALDGITQ